MDIFLIGEILKIYNNKKNKEFVCYDDDSVLLGRVNSIR
jgi:hypothetical protein